VGFADGYRNNVVHDEVVQYSSANVCMYNDEASSGRESSVLSCAHDANLTHLLKNQVDFYAKHSPLVKHKKFLLVGDSTMRHQFDSFCILFRGTITAVKGASADLINKCTMQHINAVAMYYGFCSRRSIWSQDKLNAQLLKIAKEVETFRAGDVILAATGVHFKRVCNKEASSQPLQFSDEKYESYARSLLSIVNTAGKHRCQQLSSLPTVLWRDVLPQHFPSSNGLFDPSLHPKMTTPCAAMTPAMYHGQSRAHQLVHFGNGAQSAAGRGVCEPNCLPANWQNAVIKTFLSRQCISSVPVFDAVACLHEEHYSNTKGDAGDCTHYSLEVNHFLNDRFLSELASAKPIRNSKKK
jgi:hypothetical protein